MNEHTPLPWTVVDPAALDYREPVVLGADGTCRVAWMAGGGPRRAADAAEARANAAFIVRAANSHDALVKALELAKVDLDAARIFVECHEEAPALGIRQTLQKIVLALAAAKAVSR
jgi:hypothetical protein